jgi:hypothetical protein
MAGRIAYVSEYILKQLVKRYKLQTTPYDIKEHLTLPLVIQPVTLADDLLMTPVIPASVSKDISAAAGTYVAYFTVPDGKLWRLLLVSRPGTTANSRIGISNGINTSSLTNPSTATEKWFAAHDRFLLKPGWSVGMFTTGDGADSAIGVSVVYLEEDSYSISD